VILYSVLVYNEFCCKSYIVVEYWTEIVKRYHCGIFYGMFRRDNGNDGRGFGFPEVYIC